MPGVEMPSEETASLVDSLFVERSSYESAISVDDLNVDFPPPVDILSVDFALNVDRS